MTWDRGTCRFLLPCQDRSKGLKDYVDDIVEESRSKFHYDRDADAKGPQANKKKGAHLGSKAATGNFDEDTCCTDSF